MWMLDLQELLSAIPAARYFPGDPPLYELGVWMSCAGILCVLFLLLMTYALGKIRLLRRASVFFKGLLLLPLSLLILLLLGSCAGIASRHFGEWAELKRMLQHYSEQIEHSVDNPSDPLTTAEMVELEKKFLAPAPSFKFKRLKDPVYLRMVKAVPPYVGLDFGKGANAVLDPLTMICTYAD